MQSQTQRIRLTSRLDASSLHGNDDHSVRAHAAKSLHMSHRWSPRPNNAHGERTDLRLRVSSLTTYECDDLAPARTVHVRPSALSPPKRDGEHIVSSTTHSELPAARRTYSVDEAAAILGISRTTAYECVKSKELPALRFRGRIVISAAVIDALLADHATP